MRTEINEIEGYFKSKYPVLLDFMETTLWPDVDGFNPIELLHRIAYFGHPSRSDELIEELKSIHSDSELTDLEIARMFNRENIGHPYEVVTETNAKDFCFSIQESLRFIVSLKKA